MIVIGLTGGIGMGKSTTAQLFRDEGVPVWDADAAVHRLYSPAGGAVAALTERFGAIVDEQGAIDRPALSNLLMNDPQGFSDLEAIVHPLVTTDRMQFLQGAEASGTPIALCDIPLLLENGSDGFVDVIVVVSAPEEVRRARVMARPGMTEEKYNAITARQISDIDKRARADYVIETHEGVDVARQAVRTILHTLGKKYPSL